MRRFGSERFKTMLGFIVNQKSGEEIPLESKMFSRFVENAQKRIEGNNFDARKTVLEYDEVLRKQREIIYGQRSEVLFLDDISDIILKMMTNTAYRVVGACLSPEKRNLIDAQALIKEINGIYFSPGYVSESDFEGLDLERGVAVFVDKCKALLDEKRANFPRRFTASF